MATLGNLPPTTSINSTTNYFNNFFSPGFNISGDTNDAVIAFFQQSTGDKEAGKVMAASVLYTAQSQGMDPLMFIDELKRLKTGRKTEVRTPIDPTLVVKSFTTYQQLMTHKDDYNVGQLFYIPQLNVFYKLKKTDSGITSIDADTSYVAEAVTLTGGQIGYNFFIRSYSSEENELNAYLIALLNLNRVNTSLLGLNNSPQTNKYIKRAILL